MKVAVVGAGPIGLVTAYALAERGHDVVVVDPDPGPTPDGSWRRRGVMQFMHPHFFRHQVREGLTTHAPAMWDAVLAAGAVVCDAPEMAPPHMTSLACRRLVFERALRGAAREHGRVDVVQGHAESVVVDGDRVTGVVVDGSLVDAELVVAASGRTSRFADDLRPPAEGGPCGLSYVSRMYRARPGVEPLSSNVPLGAQYPGYLTIVFPQDAGTLSALIVRASSDSELSMLWQGPCFEAAAALIPNLAPWTDPERFEPITDVMRGGTLTNSYRGQGSPPAGLYFIGDAVCTTNPSAGRGITLGFMQVAALLRALEEHGNSKDASGAFEAECLDTVKPWYDDHVVDDAWVVKRYAGEDLDLDGQIPSDVIASAALEKDPSLMPVVGPYLGMITSPRTMASVQEPVRELLRGGWRPKIEPGPDRDTLVDHLTAVASA
jgi:2-polyprenyl-6-methoxyphenol hydroxylase-like FAD-dependent oxidoreductase